MAACAETIVKTLCFERFHFLYLFSNLVSRGMDLGHILVSFGGPGGFFMIFEGPGDRLKI